MRVAIYSRVSTAGQKEEGFSLQDQERRLRMFCQQKGYEVIDHSHRDIPFCGPSTSTCSEHWMASYELPPTPGCSHLTF